MTTKAKATWIIVFGSLIGTIPFIGLLLLFENVVGVILGLALALPIWVYAVVKSTKITVNDTQSSQLPKHTITLDKFSIVTQEVIERKEEIYKKPVAKPLKKRVLDTDYISNLRVGRSWVLPQMVDMCFNGTRFSKYKYLEAVESIDYNKSWVIALRNYRVVGLYQDKIDEYRSSWWTKDVAVAMAQNDLQMLKEYVAVKSRNPKENCSGGPYIRLELRGCKNKYEQMYFTGSVAPSSKWYGKGKTLNDLYHAFEARISEIEQAQTPKQVYNALKDYDDHRCVMMQTPTPSKAFRNAFMGDGAFTSMMTLVKFLNLCYKDDIGNILTREQCIEDIQNKAKAIAYDGEQMFAYLAEKFFDANAEGGFDISKYRQGNH